MSLLALSHIVRKVIFLLKVIALIFLLKINKLCHTSMDSTIEENPLIASSGNFETHRLDRRLETYCRFESRS